MVDELVPRDLLVGLAERPGEAGARRRQGGEAETLEQPRRADVPRVRHQEEPILLVQLPEARAAVGGGHDGIFNDGRGWASRPMRPFAIALVLTALASSAGSSAAAPPPLLIGDNGLPAAVRAGAARYFAWIDSRGGVNGRRIGSGR